MNGLKKKKEPYTLLPKQYVHYGHTMYTRVLMLKPVRQPGLVFLNAR